MLEDQSYVLRPQSCLGNAISELFSFGHLLSFNNYAYQLQCYSNLRPQSSRCLVNVFPPSLSNVSVDRHCKWQGRSMRFSVWPSIQTTLPALPHPHSLSESLVGLSLSLVTTLYPSPQQIISLTRSSWSCGGS